MASKKIDWRLAGAIAEAIADKAFEHLLNPARKKYNEAAGRVWLTVVDGLPMELLLERGFLQRVDSAQIDLRCTGDASENSNLRVSYIGSGCYQGYHWETPRVTDDALYAELSLLTENLRGLEVKHELLRRELKAELEDKTATAAMKAWPEAAEIIANIAQVGNPTAGFTTPLDSMLAKYLPMLAAPQGA